MKLKTIFAASLLMVASSTIQADRSRCGSLAKKGATVTVAIVAAAYTMILRKILSGMPDGF